ncbi:hypothetical protein [Rahnella inusitata]|uniref:hypothetical protein n=1 Tax=Rahnella inusitata TaxID=58169 RepID=UPI001BC83BEA|nr:hypothetical protein [Rahnella inusitata]QUT14558.1 hypothetical protein I2123_18100 [Rahnella inusitata]
MEQASTFKELIKALLGGANTIEVHGDITKGTIKLVSSGAVSWAIAFGAVSLSFAALALVPATGGASSTAEFLLAPAAVAAIGWPAALAALSITTSAGSLAALKKLRKYKVEDFSDGYAVLVKK